MEQTCSALIGPEAFILKVDCVMLLLSFSSSAISFSRSIPLVFFPSTAYLSPPTPTLSFFQRSSNFNRYSFAFLTLSSFNRLSISYSALLYTIDSSSLPIVPLALSFISTAACVFQLPISVALKRPASIAFVFVSK